MALITDNMTYEETELSLGYPTYCLTEKETRKLCYRKDDRAMRAIGL